MGSSVLLVEFENNVSFCSRLHFSREDILFKEIDVDMIVIWHQ